MNLINELSFREQQWVNLWPQMTFEKIEGSMHFRGVEFIAKEKGLHVLNFQESLDTVSYKNFFHLSEHKYTGWSLRTLMFIVLYIWFGWG